MLHLLNNVIGSMARSLCCGCISHIDILIDFRPTYLQKRLEKKLPSLLDILKSVGDKPVQIELKYWKWK